MTKPTTFATTTASAGLGLSSRDLTASAGYLLVDPAETAASLAQHGLELPDNFPVQLTATQIGEIAEAVGAFSLWDLPVRDIPQMGKHSEIELRRHLDSFLDRVNKHDHPVLFKLTDELGQRFDEAKLEQVATRIMNEQPGMLARLYGALNPRYLRRAAARVWEDVARDTAARSKTLSQHVNSIEKKLVVEMDRVSGELDHRAQVKAAYEGSLMNFAIDTAMMHNAVLKANREFADAEPRLKANQQLFNEVSDKLAALKSRALAIEGSMSRLPADQDTLRELVNAGLSTLLELAITQTNRFNSIKMELIALSTALDIQGVQRLGDSGAALDANLGKARAMVSKAVVATAAAAPGKNRAAEAKRCMDLALHSRELKALAEKGRVESEAEMQAAKVVLAQARAVSQSLPQA